MNLVLIGKIGEYRVRSLLKMFFPAEKFYMTDRVENDGIILRIKTGSNKATVLAIVKLAGRTYRKHSFLPTNSDDSVLQEALCTNLYKILCKALDVELAWGRLTGVRPVKRVRSMIEDENILPEFVAKELEQRFFVSREKAELCVQTYKVQKNINLVTNPEIYSLYVSVPFCPSRCSYCSFVSQAVSTSAVLNQMDKYVQLLCDELRVISQTTNKLALKLKNIYIGGGTPTILEESQLELVLNSVRHNFDISNCNEFTVEAGRPDTIDLKKLMLLKAYGVNRVSINPQSFNDGVLVAIGRNHTAKQVIESFYQAREAGFDWINMDIIAGLPSDTLTSFEHTIKKAVGLSPENITVHTLTVKRSSRLNEEGKRNFGEYAAKMTSYAQKALQNSGYFPFYLYRQKNMVDNLENVGYSKPEFESPYNVSIMEENQIILAAGAGGVSKLVHDGKIERVFNFKYPNEYINCFKEMINRKNKVVSFFENNTQR